MCVCSFFVVGKRITKENPFHAAQRVVFVVVVVVIAVSVYNYRSTQQTRDLNANIRTGGLCGGCLILQLFSPSYCSPLCGSWSAVMCYVCDFVCSICVSSTWAYIYMHLLIMYVYLYTVLVILYVPTYLFSFIQFAQ